MLDELNYSLNEVIMIAEVAAFAASALEHPLNTFDHESDDGEHFVWHFTDEDGSDQWLARLCLSGRLVSYRSEIFDFADVEQLARTATALDFELVECDEDGEPEIDDEDSGWISALEALGISIDRDEPQDTQWHSAASVGRPRGI